MSDLEALLRRELRGQWVAYDDARAQQMIDAATSTRLLAPRSYGAPLAAAAAVLVVTGTATAIAAHSGDSRGPAGGGAVTPRPTTTAPQAPSKPPRPIPRTSVPPTPSRVPSSTVSPTMPPPNRPRPSATNSATPPPPRTPPQPPRQPSPTVSPSRGH